MKHKNDFYPNDPFPSIISNENSGKPVKIVAIHNWGKVNNWDIAAVYNVDGTNVFYLHSDKMDEHEESMYGAEASIEQLHKFASKETLINHIKKSHNPKVNGMLTHVSEAVRKL